MLRNLFPQTPLRTQLPICLIVALFHICRGLPGGEDSPSRKGPYQPQDGNSLGGFLDEASRKPTPVGKIPVRKLGALGPRCRHNLKGRPIEIFQYIEILTLKPHVAKIPIRIRSGTGPEARFPARKHNWATQLYEKASCPTTPKIGATVRGLVVRVFPWRVPYVAH